MKAWVKNYHQGIALLYDYLEEFSIFDYVFALEIQIQK